MLSLLREEKGNVVVLTALALTCLLGITALAVDIGLLWVNKVQLSNMVDAAALAGVQELPERISDAETTAQSYAAQNGKSGDSIQVTVSDDKKVISVKANRTVTLFFAKIFHTYSSTVTASASAAIKPLSIAQGAVPLGIEKQQFVYGQLYTLKEGAGDGYSGNYGALALGGTGSPVYNNNLKYGYKGNLSNGQWVETETGNMSGPTSEGINYRMVLDTGATFDSVQKGSPRIVIVPIIDSLAVNGRSQVQIIGFAAFFLEGVGGSGKSNYVSGRFMQLVAPGDLSDTATDYGLYGTTLIQ